MGGEHDKALKEALLAVAAAGWVVARVSKGGYRIMRCGCGAHQETFHKTPSDPRHFRNKAKRMVARCSTEVR